MRVKARTHYPLYTSWRPRTPLYSPSCLCDKHPYSPYETHASNRTMAAKQFLLRILSDYALLSAFAGQTSARDLFRLSISSRDLWKAVHSGATSPFFGLDFSAECAQIQLPRALARSWFHCNSMNPPSVPCEEPTQRCYMCPNKICTVSS
jgi:hypothetical protein